MAVKRGPIIRRVVSSEFGEDDLCDGSLIHCLDVG